MADRALDKVLGFSSDHHYHKPHLSIVKGLQHLVNKLLHVKSKQVSSSEIYFSAEQYNQWYTYFL